MEQLADKYAAEADRIERSDVDDYDAAGQELGRVADSLGRLTVRLRTATKKEQPGDRLDRATELAVDVERIVEELRETAADLSTMGPIPLPLD